MCRARKSNITVCPPGWAALKRATSKFGVTCVFVGGAKTSSKNSCPPQWSRVAKGACRGSFGTITCPRGTRWRITKLPTQTAGVTCINGKLGWMTRGSLTKAPVRRGIPTMQPSFNLGGSPTMIPEVSAGKGPGVLLPVGAGQGSTVSVSKSPSSQHQSTPVPFNVPPLSTGSVPTIISSTFHTPSPQINNPQSFRPSFVPTNLPTNALSYFLSVQPTLIPTLFSNSGGSGTDDRVGKGGTGTGSGQSQNSNSAGSTSSNNSQKLSTGAMAGIAVTCIILILVGVAVAISYNSKKKHAQEEMHKNNLGMDHFYGQRKSGESPNSPHFSPYVAGASRASFNRNSISGSGRASIDSINGRDSMNIRPSLGREPGHFPTPRSPVTTGPVTGGPALSRNYRLSGQVVASPRKSLSRSPSPWQDL